MTKVYCEGTGCPHNKSNECSLDTISLGWETQHYESENLTCITYIKEVIQGLNKNCWLCSHPSGEKVG